MHSVAVTTCVILSLAVLAAVVVGIARLAVPDRRPAAPAVATGDWI